MTLSPTTRELTQGWLASGNGGASAQSIAAHLADVGLQNGDYPSDAGDFERCEKLLDAVPELRPMLKKMREVNAYWAGLADVWDVIRLATQTAQTNLIKGIIVPIEEADPHCVKFGDNASLRSGPITFTGATPPPSGDNSRKFKPDPDLDQAKETAYRVTASELRSFVERFERLEIEKKDITDHQKEVMAEAKSRGYDTKTLRKIVALRKKDPQEVSEEEAVLDMYKEALGM